MNYLSHFRYNELHGCGANQPEFALGVALPDLWPRYSRSVRIRWRRVRALHLSEPCAAALRCGLLNHAEADRHFHTLPWFLRTLRDVKRCCGRIAARHDVHTMLVDFVSHVAIELALDHHLLQRDASLAERFFAAIERVDAGRVAMVAGLFAGRPLPGLDGEINGFIARRGLGRYIERDVLVRVLWHVLGLTRVRVAPPPALVETAVDTAIALADPERVWAELPPAYAGDGPAATILPEPPPRPPGLA